jgi:thiamine biosynthesis lipoprotein
VRVERFIQTWGTVIVVDVAAPTLDEDSLNAAIDKVALFFHHVDDVFSTYKESSQVSQLRAGSLALEDTHEDLRHVWQLCVEAKELTLGAFDPWAAIGGFDPSGIVKGWAAHCAADMLVADGVVHILINAAGDLVLRGGDLGDGSALYIASSQGYKPLPPAFKKPPPGGGDGGGGGGGGGAYRR